MMVEIRQCFKDLRFANTIEETLVPYPFSKGISDRVFTLLQVLQTLVEETDSDGKLSEKGNQLLQEHFTGKKAWFTDSSEDEKNRFKDKLTFQGCFCPWHGKIKIQQFRIHFEWPIPTGQRYLKIVYIGPKLTKK